MTVIIAGEAVGDQPACTNCMYANTTVLLKENHYIAEYDTENHTEKTSATLKFERTKV